MSTPAIPKAQQAGPATTGLQVSSRSESGFRRGGRHFGPEPTTLALNEITADDADAIRAEPALVVVEVDLTPAKK